MNLKFFKRLTVVLLVFLGTAKATDFITWTTPQIISQFNLDSWLPYVVIDKNNNDICLWRQLTSNSQRTVALVYNATTGQWQSQASTLSKSVSAQGAYEQHIAMDAQGNAWAIWRQMSGLTKAIQVSRYSPTTGWWPSTQSLTLSDTTQDAYYPIISMNKSGAALACWTLNDVVQAAFANGITWSAPVSLSAPVAAQVDCFINSTGLATAVWRRFNVDHFQIESASYSNGAWQPVVVLSSGPNNAYNPHVAMDGAGNAVAVWFEQQVTGTSLANVFLSTKAAGSGWQTPVQLTTNNNARFPQVTMNETGDLFVLWEQYDGSNWRIVALNSTFGQTDPIVVLSQAGHDTFDPHVVLNNYGSAIATWQYYDSQNTKQIQVARYDSKSEQWTNSASQTLVSNPTDLSQSPQIAMNPFSGNIVLAWQVFGDFNRNVEVVQGTQLIPTIISAQQVIHRFPRSGYLANCICWAPVAGAVSYQVFAADNTTLLATITATQPLRFCDAPIVPCSSHTYYIYAIDNTGTFSEPTVVTIG